MNREQLVQAMQALAVDKPRPVKVKGWGTVHVRSLTVSEAEENIQDTSDEKNKNRFARAACRLLCDENGKRLFDPNNEEDVKLIAAQPWSALRLILNDPEEEQPKGK